MRYLFIDTCADKLIISIIKNMEMIYYFEEKNDTNLSSRVMPIIDEAFNKSNLKPSEIDKIFIVNGPGSFTGIRVGVTIAKTMGYCLNIPIISLSELELLATTFNEATVPIIDARRGYVFGAIYDANLNPIVIDQHILLDELKKQIKDEKIVDCNNASVDILKIIKKHEFDKPINHHELMPNYLKKTEAEENL